MYWDNWTNNDQRCVHGNINLHAASQIPQIFMPRNSIPVPLPTLWASNSPSGLYESVETSHIRPQSGRDLTTNIFRRHANNEHYTCRDKIPVAESNRLTGECRVYHKPGEECTGPSQTMEFLGLVLNSVSMALKVPESNIKKIAKEFWTKGQSQGGTWLKWLDYWPQ